MKYYDCPFGSRAKLKLTPVAFSFQTQLQRPCDQGAENRRNMVRRVFLQAQGGPYQYLSAAIHPCPHDSEVEPPENGRTGSQKGLKLRYVDLRIIIRFRLMAALKYFAIFYYYK